MTGSTRRLIRLRTGRRSRTHDDCSDRCPSASTCGASSSCAPGPPSSLGRPSSTTAARGTRHAARARRSVPRDPGQQRPGYNQSPPGPTDQLRLSSCAYSWSRALLASASPASIPRQFSGGGNAPPSLRHLLTVSLRTPKHSATSPSEIPSSASRSVTAANPRVSAIVLMSKGVDMRCCVT